MLFQFVLAATDTMPDPLALEMIILSLIKILFLVGFGIYVAFAFIATRQIGIMRKTIITTFSPVVTILGYMHLAAAVLVWLFFAFAL